MEFNKEEYNQYLNGKKWRAKRLQVAKRAKFTCEKCLKVVKKGFHIHHLTYKRFGNEKLSDLVFLCKDCHEELHKCEDKSKIYTKKDLDNSLFSRVNRSRTLKSKMMTINSGTKEEKKIFQKYLDLFLEEIRPKKYS